MADDLHIGEDIVIPAADLQWTAARSGGPGGQHVNKTATKIDLRLDLEGTRALPPAVKRRLRELPSTRLDADGRLVITSQAGRSQVDNLADAREKLAALILRVRRPPKTRRPTRPTAGSKRRRLDDKRERSQKKAARGRVRGTD